jgi:hypothetical protein
MFNKLSVVSTLLVFLILGTLIKSDYICCDDCGNVFNELAQNITLYGPQGSPGITGAVGPTGPTGAQGIQGVSGGLSQTFSMIRKSIYPLPNGFHSLGDSLYINIKNNNLLFISVQISTTTNLFGYEGQCTVGICVDGLMDSYAQNFQSQWGGGVQFSSYSRCLIGDHRIDACYNCLNSETTFNWYITVIPSQCSQI